MAWPLVGGALGLCLGLGLYLRTTSSATLLLPRRAVWVEHLRYCLSWPWTSLKLRILWLDVKHVLALPLFMLLWALDEALYGDYKKVPIKAPILLISAPRTGR
jgi:hypothetical protein